MSSKSDQLPHLWGYDQHLGPEEWPKYYPTGKNQSPINILVGCDLNVAATCCRHQMGACQSYGLAERMASELRLAGDDYSGEQQSYRRRKHLDSIGEEEHHQRSHSASSSSSSESVSADASSHSRPRSASSNSSEDSNDDEFTATDSHSSGDSYVRPHCRRADKREDIKTNTNLAPTRHCRLASCGSKSSRHLLQNTRYCVTNKKIFLGYPRYLKSMQLCNTGHNWQIDLAPEVAAHTLLTGPPFGDREYKLAQLHCHWGEDCDRGSEHQINGRSFAAEIHFVHWNCSEFESPQEAARHKHGLAVLGVLVQALDGEQNRNKQLDKIIKNLPAIRAPDSSASFEPRLDLKKLFPTNRWTYASYEGSLTTPPLSEVVDWVVFLNPIQCSTQQVEEFRQIECPTSGKVSRLIKNCRPIQPHNNRTVSLWSHNHHSR